MRALILLALPIFALAYDNNKMLCLVNKQRVKAGLQALGIDARLTSAAQQHSNDQAKMHKMSHNGSNGSDPGKRIESEGYGWQKCAENVAFGYKTEKQVMKVWMKSPGHRANILGPYTHFGSAVGYDRKRTPYYTQDFGDNHDGGNFPICPNGDNSGDDSDDDSGSDGGGGSDGMQVQVGMGRGHRRNSLQSANNNMSMSFSTTQTTSTTESTDDDQVVTVPMVPTVVQFGGRRRRHRHHGGFRIGGRRH